MGGDGLFLLCELSHGSLIEEGLSYHGALHTGLLVRHQRLLIETTTAVLALNECFLHKGIVGLGVKLVHILLGDLSLCGHLLEALRGTWAGPTLLGGQQVLLIFPLLLAGLEVDGQAFGAEPNSPITYSRPQM